MAVVAAATVCSENSVAQISAYTHDSSEIQRAKTIFPGSGNTERLLRIQSYVWAC